MSSRVGDYMLFETLGRGSFGVVRRGVHAPSGQSVAVKVMEKSRIRACDVSLNVRRELAIMKTLSHPNVVGLREVLSSPRAIYVVLDFVGGGPLFDRIAAASAPAGMPEHTARDYFRQLLRGVQYCHERGIVHRDLKPENLLIEDRTSTLRIADFGMSAFKGVDTTTELLSTLAGTPHYLPPEAITSSDKGHRCSGEKLDSWACGIILFALLAGHLPFDEDDLHALLHSIKAARISYPHAFPPAAVPLVSHLLEADPSKRWSVADALADPWVSDPERAATAVAQRTGPTTGPNAQRCAAAEQPPPCAEQDSQSVAAAALVVTRSRQNLEAAGHCLATNASAIQRNCVKSLPRRNIGSCERATIYQENQDSASTVTSDRSGVAYNVKTPAEGSRSNFGTSDSFTEGATVVDNEVEGDGVIGEIEDRLGESEKEKELSGVVPSSQLSTVRALRQVQSFIAKSQHDLFVEQKNRCETPTTPPSPPDSLVPNLPPVPPGRGCIDATQILPRVSGQGIRRGDTGKSHNQNNSMKMGRYGQTVDPKSQRHVQPSSPVNVSSSHRSVFEHMVNASDMSASSDAPPFLPSWSEASTSSENSDPPYRPQERPVTPPPAAFPPDELIGKVGTAAQNFQNPCDDEREMTLEALRQLRACLVGGETASNSAKLLLQSQRADTLRLLDIWERRILEPNLVTSRLERQAQVTPPGMVNENGLGVSNEQIQSFQRVLQNWDDEIVGKGCTASEVEYGLPRNTDTVREEVFVCSAVRCSNPSGLTDSSAPDRVVKRSSGERSTPAGIDLGLSLTMCSPLYSNETPPVSQLWDSWHVDVDAPQTYAGSVAAVSGTQSWDTGESGPHTVGSSTSYIPDCGGQPKRKYLTGGGLEIPPLPPYSAITEGQADSSSRTGFMSKTEVMEKPDSMPCAIWNRFLVTESLHFGRLESCGTPSSEPTRLQWEGGAESCDPEGPLDRLRTGAKSKSQGAESVVVASSEILHASRCTASPTTPHTYQPFGADLSKDIGKQGERPRSRSSNRNAAESIVVGNRDALNDRNQRLGSRYSPSSGPDRKARNSALRRSGVSSSESPHMSPSGLGPTTALENTVSVVEENGSRKATPTTEQRAESENSAGLQPIPVRQGSPVVVLPSSQADEITSSALAPGIRKNGLPVSKRKPDAYKSCETDRAPPGLGESIKSTRLQKGSGKKRSKGRSNAVENRNSSCSMEDEFEGWRTMDRAATSSSKSSRKWFGLKSSPEVSFCPWFASSYELDQCIFELTFAIELLGYLAVPKNPAAFSDARRLLVQIPVRRGGKRLSIGIEVNNCKEGVEKSVPQDAKSIVTFCVDPNASRHELNLFRKFNSDLVERFKTVSPGLYKLQSSR